VGHVIVAIDLGDEDLHRCTDELVGGVPEELRHRRAREDDGPLLVDDDDDVRTCGEDRAEETP
jgi:hypothetical protein